MRSWMSSCSASIAEDFSLPVPLRRSVVNPADPLA
jgi:hypothetical protein